MFLVRVFDVFIKDCLFSFEAFQIADFIRVLGYPLACRFENSVFAALLYLMAAAYFIFVTPHMKIDQVSIGRYVSVKY